MVIVSWKISLQDPYAYFSDVWQENRPQKPQNASPSKHYPSDNNYSREGNYNDNKYKSDSQWDQRDSYQEVNVTIHKSVIIVLYFIHFRRSIALLFFFFQLLGTQRISSKLSRKRFAVANEEWACAEG